MTDIQLLRDIVKKLEVQQNEIDSLRQQVEIQNAAIAQIADILAALTRIIKDQTVCM